MSNYGKNELYIKYHNEMLEKTFCEKIMYPTNIVEENLTINMELIKEELKSIKKIKRQSNHKTKFGDIL